jgi:hypothetical protein
MRMIRIVVTVGTLVLSLAGGVMAQVLEAGKAAPKWDGRTVGGMEVKSDAYAGKVVLLNFFNNY